MSHSFGAGVHAAGNRGSCLGPYVVFRRCVVLRTGGSDGHARRSNLGRLTWRHDETVALDARGSSSSSRRCRRFGPPWALGAHRDAQGARSAAAATVDHPVESRPDRGSAASVRRRHGCPIRAAARRGHGRRLTALARGRTCSTTSSRRWARLRGSYATATAGWMSRRYLPRSTDGCRASTRAANSRA